MEWGDALAETFLAEAQVFGEDVFFRGGLYKAVVGISDQIKGLEMGGYLEQQSLEIIFPKASLVGLNDKPKVNEIIEARNAGYRIHTVQFLEQDYSYDLTCELIPQYIPKGLERKILYRQPSIVSNIQVGILADAPTKVESLTKPIGVTNVEAKKDPIKPSNVFAGKMPASVSNIIALRDPVMPSLVFAGLDSDGDGVVDDYDYFPLEPLYSYSKAQLDALAVDSTIVVETDLVVKILQQTTNKSRVFSAGEYYVSTNKTVSTGGIRLTINTVHYWFGGSVRGTKWDIVDA